MDNHARECPLCGGVIPAFITAYTLRMQLFAEAGTIHLTPDDLAEDHERRMREVIEEATERDPQELMDEVFESYTITVCRKCRDEFHQQFDTFLKKFKDKLGG